MFQSLIVLLLLVGVKYVSSSFDCKTQLPWLPTEYTAEPQTWPPPYRIQVYPTYFEPGSHVQVEIRGNFDATFEGFYLQARRAQIGYGSLDEAIGQFDEVVTPYDTEILDCDPGTMNTWTSIDDNEKPARIINWTAPDSYEGPIVFRATIIKGPESVYFVNVISPVVNSMSELHCRECYYTDTDGVPDADRDNREACYYFPHVLDVVKCADEVSLRPNFAYRCYTSEWKKTLDSGEVEVGIRRGCVGVNVTRYDKVTTTSDSDDIQDLYSFTLKPGEQLNGRVDLCYSPGCNDKRARLQCYTCNYHEVNGVPDSYDENNYDCHYDPTQLEFKSCDFLLGGYTSRCYTSVYRRITKDGYGDGYFEQGIRRGCVAVNIDEYGSVSSTSDINDIEELFDFELDEGDVQTGTTDMCDTDFCNDEPAELKCYSCKYDEINGIGDPNTDNKEACYYHPSLLDTVNCEAEEERLRVGEMFRCYTSRYTTWTIYGDLVTGIRRGCIAVQWNPYAALPSISDIEKVQEIFDFTLPPGDIKIATVDFCDTEFCNDDDGLQCHSCYYSETNEVPEASKQSRDLCYRYPLFTAVINCIDEGPLLEGQVYRCYRSDWLRNYANGDVQTGISRGCVAVDKSSFGEIPWTANIQYIQQIFDFTLGPGDSQEGIADFCDSDKCNDLLITEPEWSAWGPYSICSRSCGAGTQTRTRTCDDSRQGDDIFCEGPSSETISCNTQGCPIDPDPGQAIWTSWSSWGLCSVTCGYGGSRARTRVCVDNVVDNIDCDGHDYETIPCNEISCPSGGMWSTWSSWGGCSVFCGYGERLRTRSCIGSDDCFGDYYDTDDCYIQSCDIEWTPWSPWSVCNVRCGNGIRQRTRVCLDPLGRNDRCVGSTRDMEVCSGQYCEEDAEEKRLNIGAVIGITIGVLAFLILCLVLFLIACCIMGQSRQPRTRYVVH